MEMQQLQYFLAVADLGSFTGAARACHVSQPALSSQVAKLEAELGGPLLERGRQGAKLSPRGEIFRLRAAEALRQLESGRMELEALSGLESGAVTLGCLPTTGAYVLPPLLKAFSEKYPKIQVQLREASSPELSRLLKEGDLELGILDEAGLGPGLSSELLFSEALWIALPPGHPLAAKKALGLKALAKEPFILMKSGHGFRKIVLDALKEASVEPRVIYESDEIETVQALVEMGLGVSLVPAMVRKSQGPRYVAIRGRSVSRSLFLAWRERSVLSPAALALQEVGQRLLGKKLLAKQGNP